MSVLCQKDYTVNVTAPCLFIQDNANDSILINGGVAYSPERNEVLAVSGNIAALYPIMTPGRVGGAKVVMPALGRGVAWCPSVSKYYITFNNSTVRVYDPATSTFSATVIAMPTIPDGIVYAASTDLLYVIVGSEYIMQINPHTNVATQLFDGGGVDDYGIQIAYAPSINAIVGRLTQGASLFAWILSLPGNAMSTTLLAPFVGVANGVTWDTSRNRIWVAEGSAGIVSFLRVDPFVGIDHVDQIGQQNNTPLITYDLVSDSIYFNSTSNVDFITRMHRLQLTNNNTDSFHTFTDTGFIYESGCNVVVANTLFFTGCFRSAGAVNAIRSCAVSQIT